VRYVVICDNNVSFSGSPHANKRNEPDGDASAEHSERSNRVAAEVPSIGDNHAAVWSRQIGYVPCGSSGNIPKGSPISNSGFPFKEALLSLSGIQTLKWRGLALIRLIPTLGVLRTGGVDVEGPVARLAMLLLAPLYSMAQTSSPPASTTPELSTAQRR
jgi:hypothetical protein